MNKTTNVLLGLVLLALIAIGAFVYQNAPQQFGGGAAVNVKYYKTGTNATAVCSGATSTLILAAATRQDTRNAFELTASSSAITLCKSASGCQPGAGVILPTGQVYKQTDAYYGAYSCIGNGGVSSTVGTSYNQT